MAPRTDDPNRLLASLCQRSPRLELSTLDLCFLAALQLRASGARLTSFDEARLVEVFEQVCEVLEPAAENIRVRATHAIRRLREQRLLARVDGAGIVRAGEYALTRLASAIVEFFLEEEVLTRESLTVLTRTLISNLAEILTVARKASGTTFRDLVVAPLRITVSDLVDGIERRQRGLDLQQEEFQTEIAKLLESDWFGAIGRCQELLESTANTLRELNEVLLRDGHQLQALLQDVQELAADAGVIEAETVAHRLMDHVDRIAAWGAARQRAWSEYYEYVHRYLRDVVRLDPSRALTQRLREQLSAHKGRPFALTVASAPSMRLLREVEPPEAKPPVRRPRAEREPKLEATPPVDPFAVLEDKVRAALAEGVSDLSELTARVTAEFPVAERFLVAGRVAQIVGKLTRPLSSVDRPWVPVSEQLVIEEWKMERVRGG